MIQFDPLHLNSYNEKKKNTNDLVKFFAELDDKTRASRFAHPVSQEYAIKYAESLDTEKILIETHVRYGHIVAVGELHEISPTKAEIAIVVNKEYQNMGIGSKIFASLVKSAKQKGYTDIYSLCLPSNTAMKKMALDNGMQLKYHNGDVTGELHVPDRINFNVVDNWYKYVNMIILMEKKAITDFYDFWKIITNNDDENIEEDIDAHWPRL